MSIAAGWAQPSVVFNNQYLLAVEPMAISIEGSSEQRKALKYSKGKLVTAGSAEGTTTYTMTVGVQAITWPVWQMALGQLATKETLLTLPALKEGLVPLTGAAEINDPDITDANVFATIANKGAWGGPRSLTKVAGTPGANEFAVGTGKLTFPTSLAGARILYRVMKGYANWDAIGATATPVLLNQLAFDGEVYGDEESGNQLIHIPSANRISAPSVNPNNVTELQIQYELITTGSNPLPWIQRPRVAY